MQVHRLTDCCRVPYFTDAVCPLCEKACLPVEVEHEPAQYAFSPELLPFPEIVKKVEVNVTRFKTQPRHSFIVITYQINGGTEGEYTLACDTLITWAINLGLLRMEDTRTRMDDKDRVYYADIEKENNLKKRVNFINDVTPELLSQYLFSNLKAAYRDKIIQSVIS